MAYDVGGTELYVVDATGPLLTLTAQETEPLHCRNPEFQGVFGSYGGETELQRLCQCL